MKLNNCLNRILFNKEQRVKNQGELIDKYNSALLSLTINIPGATKLSDDSKYIYEVALQELKNLGLKELDQILTSNEAGCEALICVEIDAIKLKTLTSKIEENHPLGRFMDIDVIDKNKQILSRKIPRKCYICETNAKECARSQKHALKELLDHISTKVHDYKTSI